MTAGAYRVSLSSRELLRLVRCLPQMAGQRHRVDGALEGAGARDGRRVVAIQQKGQRHDLFGQGQNCFAPASDWARRGKFKVSSAASTSTVRQLSAVRATTRCEAARPKPPHEAARPTPAALPRTGPAARWGRQAAAGRPEGRDAASDKRGARTSTFVISRTHTCFEQLRRSTKHRNKFARRQRAHAFVARSTTPPSSSEISTEPSGATSTSAGRPHTSAPLAHPDTQDETSYGPSPVCASSEIFWTW